MLYEFLIIYLIVVSAIAVVITVFDKISAKLNKRRISERALLTVSTFGGSIAMLLTMMLVRHKTRKPKFMIGIPVIIVLQIIFAVLVMVTI